MTYEPYVDSDAVNLLTKMCLHAKNTAWAINSVSNVHFHQFNTSMCEYERWPKCVKHFVQPHLKWSLIFGLAEGWPKNWNVFASLFPQWTEIELHGKIIYQLASQSQTDTQNERVCVCRIMMHAFVMWASELPLF